jgi:hypothetical protein
MLKDSNRSRFCHKETPSMPLVTSRHSTSFAMHRMTNVRGRKRSCCNTTAQGTTLFVCRGESVQTNGRNVSIRMSGPSFHEASSYARSALCYCWGGPGRRTSLVTNCRPYVLPLGVFTVSQGGRKHLQPFCTRAVDTVHRFEYHQVFLYSYIMATGLMSSTSCREGPCFRDVRNYRIQKIHLIHCLKPISCTVL